jgi:hypothetical protein
LTEAPESPHLDRALHDLWHFYDEHAAQARQHEDLRATVTSILAGFAAAVVGFAGIGGLEPSDVPAGLVVIVLGVLGALLSLKHYERNRFHTKVMKVVRNEITCLEKNPGKAPRTTSELRELAEQAHVKDFSHHEEDEEKKPEKADREPWLVRTHLFHLWVALPVAFAAVGVLIVVLSVV